MTERNDFYQHRFIARMGLARVRLWWYPPDGATIWARELTMIYTPSLFRDWDFHRRGKGRLEQWNIFLPRGNIQYRHSGASRPRTLRPRLRGETYLYLAEVSHDDNGPSHFPYLALYKRVKQMCTTDLALFLGRAVVSDTHGVFEWRSLSGTCVRNKP